MDEALLLLLDDIEQQEDERGPLSFRDVREINGHNPLYAPEEQAQLLYRELLSSYQKSFQTYLQWEYDWCGSHWRDLVASSVREATHHFRHEPNTLPREAKRMQRRNILREIIRQTKDLEEQERLYKAQTGFSRSDFYRRKGEIETGDFDEHDAA